MTAESEQVKQRAANCFKLYSSVGVGIAHVIKDLSNPL